MAIYFKDEYASPTQMYGPRAYVTANGSTVLASSGLSSLGSDGGGRYTLNYSFTYPDAHAAVAVYLITIIINNHGMIVIQQLL